MSIISELNKTKDYLRSSRDAVLARGGEISTTAGLKDLPDAIYNIPADSSLAFPSDDSVAYRKVVPVGVESMARVTELGGMTYKCNNLIPYPYQEGSSLINNGVTYTVNADGSIKAVGTASSDRESRYEMSRDLPISSGNTYTVSVEGLNNQAYIALQRYVNGSWYANIAISYGTPITVTPEYIEGSTYRIGLYMKRGETVDLTATIMLNAGTTALPYEPYFEGLRSAKVTSLKSEGANLIPFPYETETITNDTIGLTATANSDGSIRVYGTPKAVGEFNPYFLHSSSVFIPKGTPLVPTNMQGSKYSTFWWRAQLYETPPAKGASISFNTYSKSATLEFDCTSMYLDLMYNVAEADIGKEVDLTFYPMLAYGTNAIPFATYRGTLDTLAIPEAVQSLPDWGEGKSATEYNYIDFVRKVFKHDYAKIRLLSTVGSYNTTSNWYYIAYQSLGISPITRSVLCNLLPSVNIEVDSSLYGIYTNYSQTHIVMRIDGFTSANEYKQWLANNEVYIIERLAEPIETDISAYLTSDGFFKVQGGGSIAPTEANGYEYTVPSTINYVQKVGT